MRNRQSRNCAQIAVGKTMRLFHWHRVHWPIDGRYSVLYNLRWIWDDCLSCQNCDDYTVGRFWRRFSLQKVIRWLLWREGCCYYNYFDEGFQYRRELDRHLGLCSPRRFWRHCGKEVISGSNHTDEVENCCSWSMTSLLSMIRLACRDMGGFLMHFRILGDGR